MAEQYKHVYKLVDIDSLPESNKTPYVGTKAECLRDAWLDVLHAGLDAGLAMADVDEAVAAVVDHVARLNRSRFRVLATNNTKDAK